MKVSYCPAEQKPCIRWIEDVFKDCLCNFNDEISFAFGVLSLISWAVAEIPQIITNFSSKSANGVSLAFLSTWIIGSARSLAGSDTPPAKSSSYIKARSGPPPVLEHDLDVSSEEDDDNESVYFPPPKIKHVGYGALAAACANLPHLSKALNLSAGLAPLEEVLNENSYGQLLGWLMAAIYMGGRIPQIWLNIQRGSVEGLNPLMFVFALLANATYVASILERSIEWKVIKANMPWLLDAIVCIALDFFYVYYRYMKANKSQHSGKYGSGDYVAADE
ncbi:hypothetical protein F511_01065 [Dorcoceras hygrometricum]|uniref:Uncharacterized protein n=1 Tax=Dorcoceras hygrometricum TaxID=472368 RepID=A0A2Z7AF04_9LAMI|nr:hypothetical protein F511_01065 [Dorcoceras hygrometricum]